MTSPNTSSQAITDARKGHFNSLLMTQLPNLTMSFFLIYLTGPLWGAFSYALARGEGMLIYSYGQVLLAWFSLPVLTLLIVWRKSYIAFFLNVLAIQLIFVYLIQTGINSGKLIIYALWSISVFMSWPALNGLNIQR